MTREFDLWLAANDNYLAAALDWLRARLVQLAEDEEAAAAAAAKQSRNGALVSADAGDSPVRVAGLRARPMLGRLFHTESGAPPAAPAAPEPAAPPPQRARIAVPAAMAEAEASETPPPLLVLAKRMGLSAFERQTLLLCLAMELDPHIAGLYARAQQDAARPFPTFALALRLFDEPAWEVMSPERPLRYWRLLEINQPGAQALIGSALKADERIVNYLKGLNYLDDRLTPLLAAVELAAAPLPPSQQSVADSVVRHVEQAGANARVPVFQLLGADSQSKLLIAHAGAERLGLSLYRLPAEQLPGQTGDLETFVRLWRRESALLPIALYVEAADLERGGGAHMMPLRRLIERDAGLLFLDVREPWQELGRDAVSFDAARPAPAEQLAAWAEALGEAGAGQPERLSAHFNFNVPTIRQIAATAAADSAAGGGSLEQSLWRDSLRRARPALEQLAQIVQAKAGWQDLELPETEKSLLRQIVDQVKGRSAVYDAWGFRERMNRGLGISVLFAGESGTGKTMAAEVIANELGLLIFRIDLSAVVSKYIGETEKNLRKLFDAAEDGGAILFFDEADALFGKRSEVKDSHDRYANIEVNYLLQRIEAFRGLAILASNMKAALDGAFLRRLRFIVNFPFPGPAERAAIWQNIFPARLPTGALDYPRLARLNLTGGSIHNIALNAAFLAAEKGTPVTMPLLLDAARTEFRKLEKPVSEADLRWLEATATGGGAP
ncbi:ATP-binding protein [Janthinobacterium fluminis]|uniref:ATP-binding protein n=1 Tax=Janthinobacterium fluminis TaxID=2987524 RepID=A0ABT5JW94_9BURK|nr:ATP-binding protein [Janthinobacterium fluminis]MDC8757013.1 ATP-binding protein [Janthinobacterium fluminis]